MPRKKNRKFEVFSLSFLDCICCGFGAVILIFVITTGRGLKVKEDMLAAASMRIKAMEEQIAEEERIAAQLESVMQSALQQQQIANAKADEEERLRREVADKQEMLKGIDAAIALKQQQLDSHSEVEPEVPVQQTQPQYLTEFSLEGKRLILLVEASGGMLGETVDSALKTLRLPAERRIQSEKWTQVREAVKTLIFYLPENADYQVVLFNSEPHPLAPRKTGTDHWIPVADGKARARIFMALDAFQPAGGANLEKAFAYARRAGADNIILLTDGLPTQSDTYPSPAQVSETHRIIMLKAAIQQIPSGVPVNTLLFPMSGDPGAASYFWRLSYDSGGSLVSPSPDWPR